MARFGGLVAREVAKPTGVASAIHSAGGQIGRQVDSVSTVRQVGLKAFAAQSILRDVKSDHQECVLEHRFGPLWNPDCHRSTWPIDRKIEQPPGRSFVLSQQ
jgi:hypothetical protein